MSVATPFTRSRSHSFLRRKRELAALLIMPFNRAPGKYDGEPVTYRLTRYFCASSSTKVQASPVLSYLHERSFQYDLRTCAYRLVHHIIINIISYMLEIYRSIPRDIGTEEQVSIGMSQCTSDQAESPHAS